MISKDIPLLSNPCALKDILFYMMFIKLKFARDNFGVLKKERQRIFGEFILIFKYYLFLLARGLLTM